MEGRDMIIASKQMDSQDPEVDEGVDVVQ